MKILVSIIAVFLLVAAVFFYALVQPLWLEPDKIQLDVVINPETLRQDLTQIVHAFAPRDAYHPENLRRCALYLKERFAAAGARVSLQRYEVDDRQYSNVIASYGPEQGERIIVGAHYDTAGELPGADDNASGVVGLLTLATWLNNKTLKQRIDLVAYTLEEPPYFRSDAMGSARHAIMLTEQQVTVRIMIALEMLGYFSDEAGSQQYPVGLLSLFYPSVGNYVSVVGKTGQGGIVRDIKQRMRASTNLPVHSINAPAFIPGIDFSDHLNYWQQGFPAVMITDTAFYRNKNYHTKDDTPDKLDYVRLAEVLRSVYYVITSYP